MLQLQEDDENTAVMRFLTQMWSDLQVTIEDIRMMKFTYDNNCDPIWQSASAMSIYQCIFSLYPKEWMITEVSSDPLIEYDFSELRSIEPWWKLIIGNKALLPLLWSMYPNHPSLLPAYYSDPMTEMGGANFNEIH